MALPSEERHGGVGKHLVDEMTKLVWHHVLIPTAMGAANMALALKYACVVIALRIEAGGWSMVVFVASCVVGITTDMGTESALGIVPDFEGDDLYPF